MLQVAVSMLTYQTTNGKKQTLAKCKKAFSLYTFQVFWIALVKFRRKNMVSGKIELKLNFYQTPWYICYKTFLEGDEACWNLDEREVSEYRWL